VPHPFATYRLVYLVLHQGYWFTLGTADKRRLLQLRLGLGYRPNDRCAYDQDLAEQQRFFHVLELLFACRRDLLALAG
jgi:hypothetical protein